MLVILMIFLSLLPHPQQQITRNLPLEIRVLHTFSQKEIECLAKNIHYESRGEPFQGMMSVAWVTLNRYNDRRYPKDLCKVVYQKHQFTWTGSPQGQARWSPDWHRSLAALAAVHTVDQWSTLASDPTGGSLWYHSVALRHPPRWTSQYQFSTQIGNHVFYREIK